jgi:hypothetical protein
MSPARLTTFIAAGGEDSPGAVLRISKLAFDSAGFGFRVDPDVILDPGGRLLDPTNDASAGNMQKFLLRHRRELSFVTVHAFVHGTTPRNWFDCSFKSRKENLLFDMP